MYLVCTRARCHCCNRTPAEKQREDLFWLRFIGGRIQGKLGSLPGAGSLWQTMLFLLRRGSRAGTGSGAQRASPIHRNLLSPDGPHLLKAPLPHNSATSWRPRVYTPEPLGTTAHWNPNSSLLLQLHLILSDHVTISRWLPGWDQ